MYTYIFVFAHNTNERIRMQYFCKRDEANRYGTLHSEWKYMSIGKWFTQRDVRVCVRVCQRNARKANRPSFCQKFKTVIVCVFVCACVCLYAHYMTTILWYPSFNVVPSAYIFLSVSARSGYELLLVALQDYFLTQWKYRQPHTYHLVQFTHKCSIVYTYIILYVY